MIRDTSAQDRVIEAPRAQRAKRFAIAGIVVVALGVGAGVLVANWRSTTRTFQADAVRVAEVTRGTLVRDASVNGRVVAAVSPTLYAPAASTVNLKVNAGDTVKKGDVLAELESPDLADALKREQSTYQELQAEVARQQILADKAKLAARRDADQAEIDRIAAERQLERVERAGIEGIVARNDYEKAKDAVKSAQIKSKHAAAVAGLETSDVDLQLKTRREQLQRQKLALELARRRVDELAIRAPSDGFIGSVAVSHRAVVPANAPLMTLVDLSRLEVELEIPEMYAADLGIGMKAEIVAGDVKATGTLSALAPEVVKNLVLARVRFDGKQPPALRQNQRVQARLLIDERKNVLMLPRGPFVDSEGGKFAYVVDGGVAVRRPIQLGATSVSAVEVNAGLQPGERVVVSGTDAFEHAERVKINE
ncbi:efflux RND transporter periplasmic adaptor subunit [Ramlibacter algicola]|uniref:Efflux RND transporter periplasmic adaptor subunit n=1 Tax=Ramlibacter algicola TaxID=2795217 RepID=A0A934UTT4_9BURK|nr:efflux RND transporter periplasmic adaptor subunit [Ramlibacter algicola]MBK0394852.1 efflux RND transporter periplasmic adaptor subunit [Ramlibacter algicola]